MKNYTSLTTYYTSLELKTNDGSGYGTIAINTILMQTDSVNICVHRLLQHKHLHPRGIDLIMR